MDTLVDSMLEFGVAGLMGVLWVWERAHSRLRERQLTTAHDRLVRRGERLDVLAETVSKNTAAMVEFQQTQRHLAEILEGLRNEMLRMRA
jgi:hypothetical protein